MILNKKGLAVLPLAALLFASCAKQISYKEAVDFVNTNYTSKDAKKITKAHAKFSVNAKDDVTKELIKTLASQVLEITLDENLGYDDDVPSAVDQPMNVITASQLINPEDDQYKDLGVKYSLKGKSLSMQLEGSMKDQTITIPEMMTIDINSAKASGSAGTNDQGYITNVQVKMDLDGTVTMLGIGTTPVNFTDANLSININY